MIGAVLTLAAALPGAATALTFSSSCDLFEVDGNEFGSADGVFDFIDEFDNGTSAPEWGVLLGTAVESGGKVTMRNPGVAVQLGPATLEISTIEAEEHGISDGSGDFTMTSDWGTTLPGTNSEFHMQLYAISPIIEAAGLTVNNLSPEVAQGGQLTGYSVTASVTQGFGGSFTTIESHSVAISPASITGHIVLRMTFDDATNMLTCAFSLDDGTTFQTPFPAMHIFNAGVNDYEVLLGAAGITPPAPPPGPLLVPMRAFEVKNPGAPTSRTLRYAVKDSSVFPPGFGAITFLGATLAVRVGATTQCFALPPGGFWRFFSAGQKLKYKDLTGVNGPVKVAQLRRDNRGLFQAKAVITGKLGPLTLVPPATQGDWHLSLGDGTEYCASTLYGTVLRNDAKVFKVKNSPAPGACGIPACSPSGAFLD